MPRPGDDVVEARLRCPRCATALVPTWSGLACPRVNACGRGGYVEGGFQFGVRA